MSSHSLAEARERLPELVGLAPRGEPVAEIRPVAADRPRDGPVVTAEALAWFDRMRVGRHDPEAADAGTLVSRMRDEDWH